jgi:hypothetical protein
MFQSSENDSDKHFEDGTLNAAIVALNGNGLAETL